MPRTWGLRATFFPTIFPPIFRTIFSASLVSLVVSVALLAAVETPLEAAPGAGEPIEGLVIEARSRWAGAGSHIVTESTLLADDGRQLALHQLGGSVDGIGMRVIPNAKPLQLGDRVAVALAGTGSQKLSSGRLRVSAVDVLTRNTLWFVRTTNGTGAALYWDSGCVFITYDSAGTSHIDGEHAILTDTLNHWRQQTSSCSYLEFVIEPLEDVEVGFDRRNVVKFRDTEWCRPAVGDAPAECYASAAAGLTTLFFVDDTSSGRNGEILDADIEMNGVDFAISANGQSSGSAQCRSDLANTFTHEAGHFLGLDHTCWTGVGERPVDGAGNPVPSCNGQLSDDLTSATMYNFQDCGETQKSTVEPDDIAGVCAIYPPADDPETCEPVSGKGSCCSLGGDTPSAAGALFLSLVCALSVRRRRRRR